MAPQKEIMQTMLRAIDGGFDVLIDSPTGTGKTYALLCAALAAQHQHRQRQIDALEQVAALVPLSLLAQQQQQAELQQLQQQQQQPAAAAAAATAADGATANADGTQPAEPLDRRCRCSAAGRRRSRRPDARLLWFLTRTHTPAPADGRPRCATCRTSRRLRASPRASTTPSPRRQGGAERRQPCGACGSAGSRGGCPHENALGTPEYADAVHARCCSTTNREPYDIEDLSPAARGGAGGAKGCSYLASSVLAKDAHLIFAPYNYVLDPRIRRV